MNTILETIAETKRAEAALLRRKGIAHERADDLRGFHDALLGGKPIGLIAEIKKASPSKGIIRQDFDVPALAAAYEQGGAHCLSVLTDKRYFAGDNKNVAIARSASSLPVLRKEFIIDPIQVEETYHIGADAMLLIVAILDWAQFADLYAQAQDLGLDVLVETHNEYEMELAVDCGARLIGINNRNLRNFTVTLDTTERLARLAPEDATLVSESGIFTRADVERVKKAGASAVLVGESLMRQDDVAAATRALLAPNEVMERPGTSD